MPFECGPHGEAQSNGEGGGFIQVQDMMSLVSPSLLVTLLSTKSVPTMH